MDSPNNNEELYLQNDVITNLQGIVLY